MSIHLDCCRFSGKHIIMPLLYPLDSLDQTPWGLFLVSKSEKEFQMLELRKRKTLKEIRQRNFTPKKKEFQGRFNQFKSRWNKCAECQMDHLEEN